MTRGNELPARVEHTAKNGRFAQRIFDFVKSQPFTRRGQLSDSTYAPRNRFASCRTSSLSILYFNVLSGIPRYSAVAVTFQPLFSSARKMKFRSNVFVAT